MPSASRQPALLFTAFEPSGDDHASAVIAELKRRDPNRPIFAWGGPRMRRAGATIIERTGDDAVMGMPGAGKIIEHLRINRRIKAWLRENAHGPTPVVAHIPVDSPAANGPICDITKAAGKKVIHLVAPQVWAWGRWRIHKLRRRTDMLLCMLPFEVEFFRQRHVPARFVGHFLFDHALDTHALDMRAAAMGDGHPRIAMMPGSRPDELERHFPILLDAFIQLRHEFPDAIGVVAATSDDVANRLRRMGDASVHGWPESLRVMTSDTDAVIRWCDIALVKSGTVTLQVAKQLRPMVIFYKKSNPVLFMLARTVLTTRYFSLPNLLAQRRIVPELIPHYGGAKPIVALATRLIRDPLEREAQLAELRQVVDSFGSASASSAAADAIEELTR